MSALSSDFAGNSVIIYDTNGNHLISTTVRVHDRDANQIRVNIMPEGLNVNDDCKLLVLTSPVPCEFRGKIKKVGGIPFIAMFLGHEKESRAAARYSIGTPALITAHIIDGQNHPIQNPIRVELINISTSGIRFRAPYYSFDNGDEFQMHMVISNNKKMITAKVVNHVDKGSDSSDYGCRFIEIV